MKLYAQKADYWKSEVAYNRSVQECIDMLSSRGCRFIGHDIERDKAGFTKALLFVFTWDSKPYQVIFKPLPLDPNMQEYATTRKKQEQQLGRIAFWWLKNMFLALDMGYPEAMVPYLQLRAPDGGATTIQQTGPERIFQIAPATGFKALPAPQEVTN